MILFRRRQTARGIGAWHLMRGEALRAVCGKRIDGDEDGTQEARHASVQDALGWLRLERLKWLHAPRRCAAVCGRCVFGSGSAGRLRAASSDFAAFRRVAAQVAA